MFDKFVSVFAFLTSLLVLAVGWVQLIESFDSWCSMNQPPIDTDLYQCVGPSLFWTLGDMKPLSPSLNAAWRHVTLLSPHTFAEVWTPFFFGLIGVCFHYQPLQIQALSSNW